MATSLRCVCQNKWTGMCKLHWTVLRKESRIPNMTLADDSIAIIGAGMGGLAAGIQLAAAGRDM